MKQQRQVSKNTTAAKQAIAEKAAAKAFLRQEAQGAAQEERHQLIAKKAYLIAEKRGFQGDMAMDDWLQAEAEVDAQSVESH